MMVQETNLLMRFGAYQRGEGPRSENNVAFFWENLNRVLPRERERF